jgi:hypothetical protein
MNYRRALRASAVRNCKNRYGPNVIYYRLQGVTISIDHVTEDRCPSCSSPSHIVLFIPKLRTHTKILLVSRCIDFANDTRTKQTDAIKDYDSDLDVSKVVTRTVMDER